jgi:CheY-like chemotaxis protein
MALSQPPTSAIRRVLVVDDSPDSLESTSLLLGLMGHVVETAVDGLQAVRVAETFRPDVILMDVALPKLDGYGATRQIRSRPWGQSIVIIAVTGWGKDTVHEAALQAGCDAYLIKPLELTDLEAILTLPAPPPQS